MDELTEEGLCLYFVRTLRIRLLEGEVSLALVLVEFRRTIK